MEESIDSWRFGAASLPMPVAAGTPAAAPATVAVACFELMHVTLDGHDYGIDVRCVVDVRDAAPPVQLFNRPACLSGSLWVAGEHAPVVDLRLALGLPAQRTPQSMVVAIDIGERVIGVVVDAVGDVVALPAHQVLPLTTAAGPIDPRHLRGRGLGQGFAAQQPVTLLDVVEWVNELNDAYEILSR
jgi:purine-binding chemotaxis protein CheW